MIVPTVHPDHVPLHVHYYARHSRLSYNGALQSLASNVWHYYCNEYRSSKYDIGRLQERDGHRYHPSAVSDPITMSGFLYRMKSKHDVALTFLPLLRDFDEVSKLSWGSATLALLYRKLCRASKRTVSTFCSPLVLLQLWAWERLYVGRPGRLKKMLGVVYGWRRWYFTRSTRM
ncbi:hypothetical protein F2Q70_00042633 [Brassica cretica]|uniref:Aminotransferase-like plant mobile domain-containing protein n=1 Tax=Brassica cretica TaxID=69181 RepID=A0A8S9KJE9_BRACR|nr:hypothetical protein F2Q70_00042633 [Brassica cretica]